MNQPEPVRRARPAGSARPPRAGRTQLLQEQIKDRILQLDLSAGDAMPTEAELAERLNVGRNSVREAIKALQAVGIVEVRRGLGLYVGKMSSAPWWTS
jgi:DNA-binding FadR family transcriptional regulator